MRQARDEDDGQHVEMRNFMTQEETAIVNAIAAAVLRFIGATAFFSVRTAPAALMPPSVA